MTNKKVRFSIVIPSFNGKDLLAKNLPSLLRVFPESEIIIVDDGSSDETVSFMRNNFPHVKLLRNKVNLGFASSANKGILAAQFSLILLLNNDCSPEKNFMPIIMSYFKDKKTFAVGCLEKKKGESRGRGIGCFRKGLFYHQPGKLNKNNTLWTFGASTFYNKKIFERLGGFDENFNPFYWEDFDLSYRALKSGYKIYFEKRAVIHHQESSTISKYYSKSKIQQISIRNQFLTCWKNLTDKDLIIRHLLWLLYYLTWAGIKTRGNIFIGFMMALIKLPKILKLRKINQFIYSDKEVLEPFQKELLI